MGAAVKASSVYHLHFVVVVDVVGGGGGGGGVVRAVVVDVVGGCGGDLTILAGVDPISNLGTALPVMAAWNSRSSSSLERSSTMQRRET